MWVSKARTTPAHTNVMAETEPSKAVSRSSSDSVRGFTLGTIFQVKVQVDWSLLIIFALILVNLGAMTFPSWHPGWSPLLTWSLALAASILFFASILAHELSHALVARTQGIVVKRITLFLFGGLAHMEGEPSSPRAEFYMAIVGPVTSLAIGFLATFAGLSLAAPGFALATAESPEALQAALRAMGPGATLLLWLGPVNIVLGIFNVIPGFPLDGGRVFRALIWRLTGDLTKATRWAAGAGQVLGWTLIAFGAMNAFSGALAQGMWLLLIGWFLNSAARMSYEQVLYRKTLGDVSASRLMRTRLQRVGPELSLEAFTRDYLMASDQKAFPVEDDGRLVGLVAFEDVQRVPAERWSQVKVRDIMIPSDKLSSLTPDTSGDRVLNQLATSQVGQVAVVENGTLRGLIQRDDLVKWIALKEKAPSPHHA